MLMDDVWCRFRVMVFGSQTQGYGVWQSVILMEDVWCRFRVMVFGSQLY